MHDGAEGIDEVRVLRIDVGHRHDGIDGLGQGSLLVQHVVHPSRDLVGLVVALLPLLLGNVIVLRKGLRGVEPVVVLLNSPLKDGDGVGAVGRLGLTVRNGIAQLLKIGQLLGVHRLGGIESILIEPVLIRFEGRGKGGLLLVGGERGEMRVANDLVTHVVNVTLKIVAQARRLPNDAISVGHLGLLLEVLLDICLGKVNRAVLRELEVRLLRLLLLLGFLLGLGLLVFLLLGLLRCWFFFFFNLFYHLGRAKRDAAIDVLLHVHTNLLLLAGGGLDGEGSNLLGHTGGEIVLVGGLVVC